MVSFRIAAAAIAIGAASCSAPAPPENAVGTAGSLSGPADTIVELTNAERRRAGLPKLDADDELAEAARMHAGQMARAGQLAHTLPKARYPRLEDRLAEVDYDWRAMGENIAFGQRTPAQAMESWMSSKGHRANILNTMFTEIGAGLATDARGRVYYVQVFGRP